MNEMIQWSLWYGMLATLPLAVTRLLITHALRGLRRGNGLLSSGRD